MERRESGMVDSNDGGAEVWEGLKVEIVRVAT